MFEQKEKTQEETGKRKIRGKRLVFLILAIIFSFPVIPLAQTGLFTDLGGTVVFLFLYGWLPALFWWLFLRKGKGKNPPPPKGAASAPTVGGAEPVTESLRNKPSDELIHNTSKTGIERFNQLRDMLAYAQSHGDVKALNYLTYAMISFLQNTSCIILSPVLSKEALEQIEAAKRQYQDNGVSLLDDLLKSGSLLPLTTTNPNGERRLAVFLSKEQIPPENAGMIEMIMDFKLACIMAKSGKDLNAIVIDYTSSRSLTLTPDMIDAVLGPKVEIKPKNEANERG